MRPAAVEGLVKRALPSPFFTFQKAAAPKAPPRPLGDEVAIKQALGQQSGLAIERKPNPERIEFAAEPLPAKKAVVKPMTSAREPAAPVAMRFEAQRRIASLEAKHERTKAQLEQSIALWTREAASLGQRAAQDAKQGVFREGLDGAVWSAELQATTAKALLRDLNADFDAARASYEALLGQSRGPGIRRGEAWKPLDPAQAQSTSERFLQRLQRYDQSVEAVKSSGVLAPIVGAAKIGAAALHGRDFDSDDYRELDGIYAAGRITDVPLGIAVGQRAVARGAAPPAPGTDHRDEAQNAIRDNHARARQYGWHDR